MDLADEGGDLGAAADRPAVGQDVLDGVDEKHERAVERQAMDDGVERPVEELVEIEGRAEPGGDLVQGAELGEPALELRPREGALGRFANEGGALLVDDGFDEPRPPGRAARRWRRPAPDRPGGASPRPSRSPPSRAAGRGSRPGR